MKPLNKKESFRMRRSWNRFFRAAYRKEPISSFVLTVGIVDAVIGGVDMQWPLFLLGLGTIGVAIALRWWKTQNSALDMPVAPPVPNPPIRYLPEQSSRPAMPTLNSTRKRPR